MRFRPRPRLRLRRLGTDDPEAVGDRRRVAAADVEGADPEDVLAGANAVLARRVAEGPGAGVDTAAEVGRDAAGGEAEGDASAPARGRRSGSSSAAGAAGSCAGTGGGTGSGTPVSAGAVVVSNWPNLPPATQRTSLGQERPNIALVTPLIRCSVSQAAEPPKGLVVAVTSPLLLARTQRVAVGQEAARIWKRVASGTVAQAAAPVARRGRDEDVGAVAGEAQDGALAGHPERRVFAARLADRSPGGGAGGGIGGRPESAVEGTGDAEVAPVQETERSGAGVGRWETVQAPAPPVGLSERTIRPLAADEDAFGRRRGTGDGEERARLRESGSPARRRRRPPVRWSSRRRH